MHFKNIDLDVVIIPVLFSGHELTGFHDTFRASKLDVYSLGLNPLNNGGQDLVFLFDIFIINLAALRLPYALHQHLLGCLRGHAAKISRRNVNFDDIADLVIAADFQRFIPADLQIRLLDDLSDRLAGVQLGAFLLAQVSGQVQVGVADLVVAAISYLKRFLDGVHQDAFVDILFPREHGNGIH